MVPTLKRQIFWKVSVNIECFSGFNVLFDINLPPTYYFPWHIRPPPVFSCMTSKNPPPLLWGFRLCAPPPRLLLFSHFPPESRNFPTPVIFQPFSIRLLYIVTSCFIANSRSNLHLFTSILQNLIENMDSMKVIPFWFAKMPND